MFALALAAAVGGPHQKVSKKQASQAGGSGLKTARATLDRARRARHGPA
jgi:hypothetical protein